MRGDGKDGPPRNLSARDILLERAKQERIRQQDHSRLHPFAPKPNPFTPITPTPEQILRQMRGLPIHPGERPIRRHRAKRGKMDKVAPVPDASHASRRKQKRHANDNA